jgi:hypothetical protein
MIKLKKYLALGVVFLFVLAVSPVGNAEEEQDIRPCFIKATFYGKTFNLRIKGTLGYYYIYAFSRDTGESGIVGSLYIKYIDGEIEEYVCNKYLKIHIMGFLGLNGLRSLLDTDGGMIIGIACGISYSLE